MRKRSSSKSPEVISSGGLVNLRPLESAVTSGFSMIRSESDSSVLTGYGVYGTGDFGRLVNRMLPMGVRPCRAFGL